MAKIVVGLVVGAVLGIVLGVMVISPQLEKEAARAQQAAPEKETEAAETAEKKPAPAPAVRLNMASAYAAEMPFFGLLAKRVESETARLSGGRIALVFHEPGRLAPVADLLGAVGAGTVDAAFASPGLWGGEVPALQLFAVGPFGPGAKAFLAWFDFGGGRDVYRNLYEKRGVHGILCGIAGAQSAGWFRREITGVKDLKGLTMRIGGLAARVLAGLGARPVALDRAATLEALKSGELDAAAYSIPAVDAGMEFHQYAKYYYFPGWQQPSTPLDLIINLGKWESLSAEQKAQIEAVCGENIRFGLAKSQVLEFTAIKTLYARGSELRRLPPPVLEALAKAWQDVAKAEAKKDSDFKHVWASLNAFRADYQIWNELSRP